MDSVNTASSTESSAGVKAVVQKSLGGKYMTFRLASEEYGLEILKVRDVIALMGITKVPRTSPFIRGLINLRGKVIPIVDLNVKFGMPETELTEQTVIIVVQFTAEDRDLTMGILVDEVQEVLEISDDQIEPRPDFGSENLQTEFILGVGKSEERIIFLLDIGRVLESSGVAEVSLASKQSA